MDTRSIKEELLQLGYRTNEGLASALISLCAEKTRPGRNLLIERTEFMRRMGLPVATSTHDLEKQSRALSARLSDLRSRARDSLSTRDFVPIYPHLLVHEARKYLLLIFERNLAWRIYSFIAVDQGRQSRSDQQINRVDAERIIENAYARPIHTLVAGLEREENGVCWIPFAEAQLLREDLIAGIKHKILAEQNDPPDLAMPRIIALWGMPGIGKSHLVRQLCNDSTIVKVFKTQQQFRGGFAAAPLGKVLPTTAADQWIGSELAKQNRADVRRLVIVDAVCSPSDLKSFLDLNPEDVVLAASQSRRCFEATPLKPDSIYVPPLTAEDSIALLESFVGPQSDEISSQLPDIAALCAGNPLALKICGLILKKNPSRLTTVRRLLENGQFQSLKAYLDDYTEEDPTAEANLTALARALLRCISEFLDAEEITALYHLAAPPPSAWIPYAALGTLWGVQIPGQEERLTEALEAIGAVEHDCDNGCLAIQTLLHRQLNQDRARMLECHANIVARYRVLADRLNATPTQYGGAPAWHALPPDGYVFECLPYHLINSAPRAAADELFLNYAWIQQKLRATGIYSLLHDYSLAARLEDSDVDVVGRALLLSSHVISTKPEELPAQLYAHLYGGSSPRIQTLMEWVARIAPRPWLRMRALSSESESENLIRNIITSGMVTRSLSLVDNGQLLVAFHGGIDAWSTGDFRKLPGTRAELKRWAYWATSSVKPQIYVYYVHFEQERKIKHFELHCWDLKKSRLVKSTTNIRPDTLGIKVLPNDDRLLLFCCKEIEVRGRQGERKLTSLAYPSEYCAEEITAIATSSDAQHLSFADDSQNVLTFNIPKGRWLRHEQVHEDRIIGIAYLDGGDEFVSLSRDDVLALWSTESSSPQLTVRLDGCHASAICAVPNRNAVATGGLDGYVRIWDPKSGKYLDAYPASPAWISSMTTIPAKNILAVAGGDNAVRLFSLNALENMTDRRKEIEGVVAISATGGGEHVFVSRHSGVTRVTRDDIGGAAACTDPIVVNDGSVCVAAEGEKVIFCYDNEYSTIRRLSVGERSGELEFESYTLECIPSACEPRDEFTTPYIALRRDVLIAPNQPEDVREPIPSLWINAARVSSAELVTHLYSKWRDTSVDSSACETTQAIESPMIHRIAACSKGRIVAFVYLGRLHVWDLLDDRVLYCSREVVQAPVTVSLNGGVAAAAWNDGAHVVDLKKGLARNIAPLHDEELLCISSDRLGRRFVSIARDSTLKVWKPGTRRVIASFTDTLPFTCCQMSPDGKTIFAGQANGKIVAFEVEERICS